MGRLPVERERCFTAMDVVSATTIGLLVGGVAAWLLAVLFVASLCQVAARSDRLGARMAVSDAVTRLEDFQSPSGMPFFPSRRHRRQLVRELSDLHVYV